MNIVGSAKLTTHENNQETPDIAEMWNNFFSSDYRCLIPNKLNDESTLAAYIGTPSINHFTFQLGVQTANYKHIPEGMICSAIPPKKYALFSVRDYGFDKLGAIWTYILADWFTNCEYEIDDNRFYFEYYDYKSDEKLEMKIYVAVK